jgi:hypothetical protein
MEHEMLALLSEFKNSDEPFRHWYFWNKSYKHFKKVHDLQENLELLMQRFVLLNYYYWHDDHLQELYCQKLRQFKNSKLANPEDIEAQIFCHTMWAMVLLDKHSFEHEMLGLLEEVQSLITMRDEKGKVEIENSQKLPIN